MFYKFFNFGRTIPRITILSSCYFEIKFVFIVTFERKYTSQHRIQKNSKRPYINLFSIIVLLFDEFRTHIRRCSTKDFMHLFQAFPISCKTCEPKINYFDHFRFFFDKNIIKFNISVSNSFWMQVGKSFNYLFEKFPANVFLYCSVLALGFDILI